MNQYVLACTPLKHSCTVIYKYVLVCTVMYCVVPSCTVMYREFLYQYVLVCTSMYFHEKYILVHTSTSRYKSVRLLIYWYIPIQAKTYTSIVHTRTYSYIPVRTSISRCIHQQTGNYLSYLANGHFAQRTQLTQKLLRFYLGMSLVCFH